MINDFSEKHNIDKSKIYILGASMGSSGLWKMISNYPKTFASAVAVSSVPQISSETPLSTLPIYLIVGAEEKKDKIEKTKSVYDKIQSSSGKSMFKIQENANHMQVCEEGIDFAVLDWVLSF